MKHKIILLMSLLILLASVGCGGANAAQPTSIPLTQMSQPTPVPTQTPATETRPIDVPPTESLPTEVPAPEASASACESYFQFCVTATVSGAVNTIVTAGMGSSFGNDCTAWAAGGWKTPEEVKTKRPAIKRNAKPVQQFEPRAVAEATSRAGASFETLADGSLRVTGRQAKNERYTLRLAAAPQTVASLQLEALPDPALPQQGPGLSSGGNFVLSEVRVLVEPGEVDDLGAMNLSREIARKIESELAYPGQVKVTVVRETRAVDYAR